MRNVIVCCGLILLIVLSGCAPETCEDPQTPRNIDPQAEPPLYDGTSTDSIVEAEGPPDKVLYTPRAGGETETLYICGQHYHDRTENKQGCSGEDDEPQRGGPWPGQWVEIHTVYAREVESGECDPETLQCCKSPTFLVRAFSARVEAGGEPAPIEFPEGRPLAEWSGSTTGLEKKFCECKAAAQWSFRLGCDFTVSQAQLGRFRDSDPARPLQPEHRLSRDLTLVTRGEE